ncbi:hypothetical protein ASD45_08465 [Pseudolabrys sp. Root1462]|uniref:hypothetical protein n=1 Tax=Pseudolabrys sp. Root1462 TaxID=1736466 RepID=UPI000703204C|nr:hypothetical protein [Pseudolabrys sp. Root1462]KQZ00886.1 hypothetical protein ASD45_08465 [Pseudolabrys sp. Root1462]
MNPLSTIIAAAVADAVAANVRLFDPKKIERAPDALTRDIVKALTRSTKEGEAEAQTEAEDAPFEWLPADSRRAKAYVNLRIAAHCLSRAAEKDGLIYVPREADGPAMLAFADWTPAQGVIGISNVAQMTAWRDFYDRVLPNVARRPQGNSMTAPWPWPPSKEGKTYDADAQEEMPAP